MLPVGLAVVATSLKLVHATYARVCMCEGVFE